MTRSNMNVRLDNLVPIHAQLGGHQTAGWTPPAPVQRDLGVQLHADVKIPMPDGVMLACDVYLPKQLGRYPVVLEFSSYNFDLDTAAAPTVSNETGSPAVFVPHGYVQVIVTARGVGRSGGELQLWLSRPLVDDLERCISWAAEQEWSNGSVVMFGTSYYGTVQPLVAVRKPPALKAFFSIEPCTDFTRHTFRFAGSPNIDFLTLWAGANFTRASMKRHVPPFVRAALSWLLAQAHTFELVRPHIDQIQTTFRQQRDVHPSALRWITALISGEEQALDFPNGPSRDLPNIDVPFVAVQNRGTVALHQFGAYDLFERAGSARDGRWLIIGPAEYELPVTAWQLEAIAFFDHVVKQANNGYAQQPRVRYYRDGSNDWGHVSDFPPRATEATSFTLHPTQGGVLAELPPLGVAEASWLALPRGYAVLPEIPETTPERVVFSWTASNAIELFGPATLALEFSCNEIDAVIGARLDLVAHSGSRHPLSFGYMRASARAPLHEQDTAAEIAHDARSRVPLVPFEPVLLRFSMTPLAAKLSKGDRLELRIASREEQIHASIDEGYHLPDLPVPYYAKNTLHLGVKTCLTLTRITIDS